MSKFILKIPAEDLYQFNSPQEFEKLKTDLDDFVNGDQKYLILPSGEGYLTEIDGEGKVTEWEVQVTNKGGENHE